MSAAAAPIVMRLSGGDAGTAQTIAQIRKLIDAGKKSPRINHRAIQIVWNIPPTNETAKAQAIFDWVLQNTRFVPDMTGCETVRTADEIDEWRAGDCDDLNAIYIPALLGTIGIPSRLVTISSHADAPEEFSHIYAEAFADGRWIPMDVARQGAAFGRAPEHYYRKRVWDTRTADYSDIAGLNGYTATHRMARRGMGDFTDTLSNIFGSPQGINAVTSGTANIIAASRANPYNLVPSTVGAPVGYTYDAYGNLIPNAQAAYGYGGYGYGMGITGMLSPGMLLIGGGLLLLLMVRR